MSAPLEESRKSHNNSESENTCVVCFKCAEIFSVGPCDHPVCYECSTRMRVLCERNECPICRQDMPKVIFAKMVEPFNSFPSAERFTLRDKKFGIYFNSASCHRAYFDLLEHKCVICSKALDRALTMKNFSTLKDHMRKEHELFYCDLCVENLKIFTFERRCYTRQELALHRRKGDPDNTSHRGHPICEYCDVRFMDSDDLFRHLRRDHMYCHFCDADGRHEFYCNYEELREHFKSDHFLCEEGDCQNEQFTSVFRSEIDLKAHISSTHGKTMSRQANKLARTLELEFTLAPRQQDNHGRGNKNNKRINRNRDEDDVYALSYSLERPVSNTPNIPPVPVTLTDQDFPTLSGDFPTANFVTPSSTGRGAFTHRVVPDFEKDFPSLAGKNGQIAQDTNAKKPREQFPNLSNSKPKKWTPNVTISSRFTDPAGLNDNIRRTVKLSYSNHQEQPSQSTSRPNVSIQLNHNARDKVTLTRAKPPDASVNHAPAVVKVRPPQMSAADVFPTLGGTSSRVSTPQWVSVSKKNTKTIIEEPPSEVTPPSSGLDNFPSLSTKGNSKKSSSVKVPIDNNWVNLNDANNRAKERLKTTTTPRQPEPEITHVVSKAKKKGNKVKSNGNDETRSNNAVLVDSRKKTAETKRSEILIDGLNISAPPGFCKRGSPPATSTIVEQPANNSSAPPGFNGALSSSNSNDLTFTSSSGESYPILPSRLNAGDQSQANGVGGYRAPPNFEERNRNLVGCLARSSDNTADMIREFKSYSAMFRSGDYTADGYYEHCRMMLGGQFEKLFPELLALLPDIERQRMLYDIHKKSLTATGAIKKCSSHVNSEMAVCATCGQVLLQGNDYNSHLRGHALQMRYGGGVNETANKGMQAKTVWRK